MLQSAEIAPGILGISNSFQSNAGRKGAAYWSVLIGGVAMLSLAVAAAPATVERLLTGESTGQLKWGPALFRALAALHGLGLFWIGLTRDRIGERYAADRQRADRSAWGIIAVILLVALGLRIWRLNTQLWLDEIATAVNYVRTGPGHILSTYDSQNHHILYSFLAWASASVFGEVPWALRLPSVLFGLGAIALIYVLGRQVTSRTEAILAALLASVLYHHVWFCQNARGYTGMLFFTLASSIFFVAGMRDSRRRTWILYAVAAALGAWVHMTMVFVVAGQFVIYLAALFGIGMKRPAAPLRPLTGFVWATLMTLLIYSLVLPQVFGGVMTQDFHEASKVKEWKNPLWTMMEIIRGLKIGFAASAGGVVAALMMGAGMLGYLRRAPVIVLMLLVPAMLGGIVLVVSHHAIWPRFFYFTLGFGVLVLVRGAFALGEIIRLSPRSSRILGATVCAGMIVMSAGSLALVYGPKQDYEGVVKFVQDQRNAEDGVAVVGVARFCFVEYHQVDWVEADQPEDLRRMTEGHQRTWLIYMFPMQISAELEGLWEQIQNDYDTVRVFGGTLRGGEIYVARSRQEIKTAAIGRGDASPRSNVKDASDTQLSRGRQL